VLDAGSATYPISIGEIVVVARSVWGEKRKENARSSGRENPRTGELRLSYSRRVRSSIATHHVKMIKHIIGKDREQY